MLTICLFIMGCGVHVFPEDIRIAEENCSTNGGLFSLFVNEAYVEANCTNGAIFTFRKESK